MGFLIAGWLVSLSILAGDGENPATVDSAEASAYEWRLPPGFPVPKVPSTNPMTAAKVELGRHLFFDPRLSSNGTIACATCHRPELAFTDGRRHSAGVTGEQHPRSAMSLTNVAYNRTLEWAQPQLTELEQQVPRPLFAIHPVEMGQTPESLQQKLAVLAQSEEYSILLTRAFPEQASEPLPASLLFAAIASFERTLVSGNSPFDRLLFGGDEDALDQDARAGLSLFLSPRLGCSECHRGFNFSGPVDFAGASPGPPEFHNTGLYNLDGKGRYPEGGEGLAAITGSVRDTGKFRAPTLRNIEVTAPYMHDGSIPTLIAVLEHYEAGGRSIVSGPFAGVGRINPYKSSLVEGFRLTEEERLQVIAFLHSLTDAEFLSDSRFTDPWR